MARKSLRSLVVPIGIFLCLASFLSARTVSLSSLLDEMVDRDAVTRFPDPAFACFQASSYDRASRSPTENWFANGDASQFVREETVKTSGGERKEWVLMDAEGPGAIVRWWITSHHYKSVCRIYLDGNDKPAVEANIGELVGGDFLTGAPLSEETARGRNLYLPIPYEKSCKVTVDDMSTQKNLYYQINYRTYAAGTEVESFTMEGFKSVKRRVDFVQSQLVVEEKDLLESILLPPPPTVVRSGESYLISTYTAQDAGTVRPSKFGGTYRTTEGAALAGIVLKVNPQIDEQDEEQFAQTLRSTVLSITFDGKETVWCPLGDFFGSGVGVNSCKNWYANVKKNGTLISHWKMPFQKTMQAKLVNYGTKPLKIEYASVIDNAYQWTGRSMYFHADWRQERKIETVGGKGTKDWEYIKLKGRGVFVGDVLSVLNRNPAWWGEGDEKIYFDGQTFPSHFGTGTEDYYGYAWCTPKFFESPFHFQPRAEGPGNYGNTTNGRVRLLDTIPFNKDFRFDMEVWHWAATKIDYAVTTFWYGFDGTEPVGFPARSEQIAEATAPVRYATPMSLEIPGFKIEKFPSGGRLQVQGMKHFAGGKWDNDDHLWWTGAKPNDKLELILDAKKEGKFKLVAELTKARDYGIVQFYLDGQKIGEPVDLYNPDVVPTGVVVLGGVELKAGRHIVVVEIVGKNDKAVSSYMVGIDRLMLTE